MRRVHLSLVFCLVALATVPSVRAQEYIPANVVRPDTLLSGEWRGNVVTASGMRYAVQLTIDAYSDGQCDVRYQVAGITAAPRRMRSASCDHTNLLFVDDSTSGAFTGRLHASEGVIVGLWESGRTRSEIRLYPVSRVRQRLQEDSGPQPYVERQLTIPLPNGRSTGATLTLPDTTGSWPVMVVVSDRGQQDRDGRDATGHRPLWVIADYCTERQWAVLRYDDPAPEGTTDDLVAVLDRLQRAPFIDPSEVILVGHGSGGVLAVQAAVRRPAMVQGVICAATPALEGRTWLTEHIRAADDLVGIAPDVSTAAAELVGQWYDVASSARTLDEQIARIGALTDSLLEARQDLLAAYEIATELQGAQRDRRIGQRILPWLQSFRDLHADSIGLLINDGDLPVLALIAERDAMVPSALNTAAWLEIQRQEPSTMVEVITGVNHGFQPCTACTTEEAAHSSTTISDSVLQRLVSWSNQRVGR